MSKAAKDVCLLCVQNQQGQPIIGVNVVIGGVNLLTVAPNGCVALTGDGPWSGSINVGGQPGYFGGYVTKSFVNFKCGDPPFQLDNNELRPRKTA